MSPHRQRAFHVLTAVLVGALVGFGGHAAAAARLRAPAFMPAGTAVAPPYGYFEFCHRQPGACQEYEPPTTRPGAAPGTRARIASRGGAATANALFWDAVFASEASARRIEPRPEPAAPRHRVVIDPSPELWRQIQRINRRVNSNILPRPDWQTFGRDDVWAPPAPRARRRVGDCEEYVLEKRRLLIEAGVPAEALSIATARLRHDDLHAVLLLSTTEGDVVLDNRSRWISPWHALGYRWEQRQIAGGKAWARVYG